MARKRAEILRTSAALTKDLSRVVGLLNSHPMTRKRTTLLSRELREALKQALDESMRRARVDGLMPFSSGRGAKSIVTKAFGTTPGSLRGHIVGNDYLAAHNLGSEILPKGRALAVPIADGLRPDGSPKLPGPRSWSNITKIFVYKSKRTKQAYLARRTADKKLSVLYILVDSIQLTKYRGWADTAWERQLPALIAEWESIIASYILADTVADAYFSKAQRR
jgi:hypothetical protein